MKVNKFKLTATELAENRKIETTRAFRFFLDCMLKKKRQQEARITRYGE